MSSVPAQTLRLSRLPIPNPSGNRARVLQRTWAVWWPPSPEALPPCGSRAQTVRPQGGSAPPSPHRRGAHRRHLTAVSSLPKCCRHVSGPRVESEDAPAPHTPHLRRWVLGAPRPLQGPAAGPRAGRLRASLEWLTASLPGFLRPGRPLPFSPAPSLWPGHGTGSGQSPCTCGEPPWTAHLGAGGPGPALGAHEARVRVLTGRLGGGAAARWGCTWRWVLGTWGRRWKVAVSLRESPGLRGRRAVGQGGDLWEAGRKPCETRGCRVEELGAAGTERVPESRVRSRQDAASEGCGPGAQIGVRVSSPLPSQHVRE